MNTFTEKHPVHGRMISQLESIRLGRFKRAVIESHEARVVLRCLSAENIADSDKDRLMSLKHPKDMVKIAKDLMNKRKSS